MKKLLILALVVFCVGSVMAGPGPNTTGTVQVNASNVSGANWYRVWIDQIPVSLVISTDWVDVTQWQAPSNETVKIGVWNCTGYPSNEWDPDYYMYKYGVEVYVNQTTLVIFSSHHLIP